MGEQGSFCALLYTVNTQNQAQRAEAGGCQSYAKICALHALIDTFFTSIASKNVSVSLVLCKVTDLANNWVLHQCISNSFAIACDHIEDARREASLNNQLCQSQSSQHGLFCWLHTTNINMSPGSHVGASVDRRILHM